MRAIFDGEMMEILKNIYDKYQGLTIRQSKNIEFLMDQYSNGDKIRSLPGDKIDYRNGEKLSRWGRLDFNEDKTYGVEFETLKWNYAKFTCTSADVEPISSCRGNIILDIVEQPWQFAKAYGCDNNLPYDIEDCSKELNVNLQCVEPNGEWTTITNMEITEVTGCTLQVDTDRRKCKNVINGAVQMFFLDEIKHCYS